MDVSGQGWGLDGAIILGGLAALMVCKPLFDEPGEATDRLALWALPAVLFARLGCFNRGCCFGLPTDSPLGIANPAGSPAANYQLLEGNPLTLASSIKTWPTQAFEGLGALLIFLIGAIALNRLRPGALTFAIPLFLGLSRLINSEFRAPDLLANADPRLITLAVIVLAGCGLTVHAGKD